MVKSVTAWLSVNVNPAVSPALTLVLSIVRLILGLTVLIEKAWRLFKSDPSVLKLPATSENLLLAILTSPFVVLSSFGVNMAV